MSDREKLVELFKTLLNSWAISPESAAVFFLSNGVMMQKHGQWENISGGMIMLGNCSECKVRQPVSGTNYCKNCGVKMSLKENN